MARHQSVFDDLVVIGSKVSWRVAVFSAVLVYVALHVVAVRTSAPVTAATLADLGSVAQRGLIHVIAAFMQYIAPVGLLIGAFIGFLGRYRSRSLLSNARSNPKAISAMSWRDFEGLVGEGFRQRGFAVKNFGGGGPDGGVDLDLTKDGKRFLVQCKHWRKEQAGVAVVRELNGVIAAEGAAGGFVVTGGWFTPDAQEFARNTAIKLIDGDELEELIGDPREQNAEDVPGCPKCGGEMIERTATRGQFIGKPFWGCRKYPKCTGTARMS